MYQGISIYIYIYIYLYIYICIYMCVSPSNRHIFQISRSESTFCGCVVVFQTFDLHTMKIMIRDDKCPDDQIYIYIYIGGLVGVA